MTRKLSCFFARELFPLYLEKRLDAPRVSQVDEHLRGCQDCSNLFSKIRGAEKLLSELSSTEPNPELVTYLKKESHFWQDLLGRFAWKRWPGTVKWAAELCVVAAALVVTIHLFPWLNLARSLQSIKTESPVADTKAPMDDVGTAQMAQDEIDGSAPPVKMAEGPQVDPPPFIGPQLPAGYVPPKPKPTAAPPVQVAAGEGESDPDEMSPENEKPGASARTTGYVWRGSLKVPAVGDELAESIKKAIVDLGGKKAGKVDLGWHRGTDRYYHFILPEQNYDKLLSRLNEEGLVELTKEKHPRVIKSGYMRIIMTLEAE